MKAKCYACDERIDHHNRCRKRACRAQLEKRQFKQVEEWIIYDRTTFNRIPWINCD